MDWWPLTRDCAIFTFNVGFLLFFAWDGNIELWEACMLLSLMLLYYVIMFNSARLNKLMRRIFEDRCCNRNKYGKWGWEGAEKYFDSKEPLRDLIFFFANRRLQRSNKKTRNKLHGTQFAL